MEQKKKITKLGGKPGDKNKATVTEEELSAKSERAIHAKDMLEDAGKLFMPEGFTFAGSAVIFYYSKETIPSHPTYTYVCHTSLEGVHEAHAGLGIQTLRQQTMKLYGHEPKEVKR